MRTGVVGAGRMGQRHARNLVLAGVVAPVVYDPDTNAAERLAAEVGGETSPSLEHLLSEVDSLVVTAPAAERAPAFHAAVRAGLPMFCEKPLSASVEQAREFAEAAADAQVQIGFQRRFDPGFRALRERVDSGAAGRVLVVRGTAFDHVPPRTEYGLTSGDIFTDCLIHDIDAVHWLTGLDTIAVQAHLAAVAEGGTAIDVATLVLTLQDGTPAVLTASRMNPLGYDHRIELLGTRDSLSVGLGDRTPLRILHPEAPLSATPPLPAFADFTDRFETSYAEEMRAFVRMVTQGEPSACTVREALLAQEVASAAARSARTGTRLSIARGDHPLVGQAAGAERTGRS